MSSSGYTLPREDLEHIQTHTHGLWEALRGRNIFVTGGTGFFGRWLLESFAHANQTLDLNSRMVVLSRNPQTFAAQAPHLGAAADIHLVAGDVRSFTASGLQKQLSDVALRFDFVIHAANETTAKANAGTPLETIDTIVHGTRRALEFAVETGARRFLFTSSGAVYGPQPSDLTHIPEDYLGGPDYTDANSAYGEGKRTAELLCACFQKLHGLEPLIARCFAFVGPFLPLDAHFAIGNFIRDALAGGPIRIGGDGAPFRSYLYATDLTIWLWTILFRGVSMRPYNVGSARHLTIAELAEKVRASIGGKMEIVIAKRADPARPASRYVPANTRAASELGLQESIDLPSAIRKTADHAPFATRISS